jgi:hypothetical protein
MFIILSSIRGEKFLKFRTLAILNSVLKINFEYINNKVMDINIERESIIRELRQVEDISLLKALKYVLHYGLKKEGRISIEQYNREMEEAEMEVAIGQYTTHEESKRQMKAW